MSGGAADPEASGPGLLAGLPPGHPALGLGGLGFTAYRLWGHNGAPFLAARYPPQLPPPSGHNGESGVRQVRSVSPTKDRGELLSKLLHPPLGPTYLASQSALVTATQPTPPRL